MYRLVCSDINKPLPLLCFLTLPSSPAALGFRGDRQKCRLMWLIEERTLPVFNDMVAKEMASYKGNQQTLYHLINTLPPN